MKYTDDNRFVLGVIREGSAFYAMCVSPVTGRRVRPRKLFKRGGAWVIYLFGKCISIAEGYLCVAGIK